MQGMLVTNAFMRSGSFKQMRDLFLDAAARADISVTPRTNAELIFLPESLPDFALFYDKDIRLAMRLEAAGVRVFNSASAIAVCDDKTLTYLALEKARVPQPDTILCPHSFPGLGYGDAAFIADIGKALGWPLVVKEGCGSFGQQVYLAQSADEARALLAQIGEKPLLFQRFIASSAGRDKRLFVVGDRVIAAIERRNLHGDFRANIENGGNATACNVSPEEEALALRACKALGLDFGGVDLLSDNNAPLVCEVNSNAHFGGLMQATGVNPANHIMQYIRRQLCED